MNFNPLDLFYFIRRRLATYLARYAEDTFYGKGIKAKPDPNRKVFRVPGSENGSERAAIQFIDDRKDGLTWTMELDPEILNKFGNL